MHPVLTLGKNRGITMSNLVKQVREYAKEHTRENFNWYFLDFIPDDYLEQMFDRAGESARWPIGFDEAIEETSQELEYIIFRVHDSEQFEKLFKRMTKLRIKDIKERIADGWL